MNAILVAVLLLAWTEVSRSQDTLSCTDNLSCPRSDPDSESLQCISASQLCDGSELCSGGQDEGENLSTLDCTSNVFYCTPGGDTVDINVLCDGTADCSNGNDETSPICENKCRSPYRGGCAELNRACSYTELDVSCGDCLSGYSEIVGSCVQGLTFGPEKSLYIVSEDDGSLEVCIDVLLGAISSGNSYSVSYTTVDGDAQAPDDYLEQSGSVDLSSSATKQCISIPIENDSIDEDEQECFALSLSQSSGATNITVSPQSTTICINDTDDSALVVGFEETSYRVDEVDDYKLVCIAVLSGDVDDREIELSYSTSSGTASTSDYTSTTGSLTIDADTTRQCVSIPIRSDSTTENLECFTFSISLSNTVANLTVEPDETTICIVDKNSIAITIGLTQTLFTVGESDGSLSVCYEVLSGRTAERSMYMTIKTVQGDATDGDDYTYSTQSDTISDSDMSDCDSISILSDSIDEDEECFTVSLSGPSSSFPGLTIDPRVGTICIEDDDPTPVTIGLQQTSYSVYETDEYQVVCAEVLSGDIAGRNIDIDFSTTSGTAEAGDDFVSFNDTFTLSGSALIQCVPVDIVSDSVSEPEECFNMSISSSKTVDGLTLSPSEAQICITDEEVEVIPEVTIHWVKGYYSVSESAAEVDVCVELSTLQFTGSVQVNYATFADSATASDDFTEASGTLTFSNTDSTECVTIDIEDDSISEQTECFTLQLSGGTETIDNPTITTVCIIDDDAYSVTVGFEQTTYTVTEVDDYQLACFKVLSGELAGRDLKFSYSTSSGTATTSDYTSTTGVATITEDSPIQCASIPIRSDSYTEGTNEYFTFQITSSTTVDGLTVSPSQTRIYIIDSNSIPITIGLTQTLFTVGESDGSISVCYKVLSGRTAERSIYTTIKTVQGDATDGDDYTYSSQSDTINDSDMSDCDSISILSDSIDEDEECFTVSLTGSTSIAGLTLDPRIGTVCIEDDDPTPVTIGLQQSSYSVYETDEYQVVCAEVLSGDIAGRNIDINYSTTSGTAQAPSDYASLNSSFEISSSALIQCVPISMVSDNADETEQCFNFSISSANTISGLELSPSEAQICISDSEVVIVPDPMVRFNTSYYSVDEGDGSVEVCIQVTTDQLDNSVQVGYQTTPGTASDPDDYSGSSGSVSLSSSNTESCVTITVVDDSVREAAPECFTVRLTQVTGADLTEPSMTTVCIEDNDVLPVTIGIDQTEYTVTEEDDYQLVCFGVQSGDIDNREIVFDYSTTSGTADTSDYSSTSGKVSITEDSPMQCISIQIRSDSYTESEQCFTFDISSSVSVTGLTVSPSETEICIIDTNAIPITIGMKKTLYNVREDAGSVSVCYAVLSGRTAGRSIYMQLRTLQGDAIQGEDYTYTYASDVFGDSDMSECDSIPILSDSIDEEVECFTVSLSTSTSLSGLTINPRIATVCINDDDPTDVEIGLERTSYLVDSNTDSQVVCATVESGATSGRDISITYSVTDHSDAQTQNGSLLFTDDVSIQCVAVSVSSVSPGSTDESCLSLSLSSPTTVSGLTLSPSLATICVVDANDIPVTIGLENGYYSVGEDDGDVEVCVEVESGDVAGRTITINYSTLDGSANAPSDFTAASSSLSLTESSSRQCISISIIDDSQDEDDRECFALSISTTSSSSVSIDTAQTTICITDNDATPVRVGLQRSSYTVTEDNALVLVCTEVESGSVSGRTITIDYSTSNGGAVAPGDYTSTSGSFDITDTNTVQCIPISIISDSVTETDEECFTYTISTTSTTPGLTLGSTSASICISGEGDTTSEDIVIGLRQSYFSVVEQSTSVEICMIVLSGDITGNSFLISYSTSNGQAEAPGDYVAASGSFSISDSSECVSVTIRSDSVSEPGLECFLVTFTTSATGFTLKSPSVATVCIRDAVVTTPVTVGLQESQYTVTDDDSYKFVCAEVTSGHVSGRDIEIEYNVVNSDNTRTQNGTMLFTDNASVQCVAVSVSSVSPGSTDESCLSLSLSSPTTVSGLTLSPSLATICKVASEAQDNTVTIGLQRSYYSIEEGGGSLQVCVEVVSGEIGGRTITVSYETIDGEARAPGDFTGISGSLTITEDGSIECLSISILDDIEDEEDVECFAFSINTDTSGSIALDVAQATICISDNDVTDVTLGLEETVYSVMETDTFVPVCTIILSGSIAGRTLTIDYQTTDGTASAPGDYTSTNGSFDMTDSNTIQCIPISIISDSVTETDEECFTYTISSTSTTPGLTLSSTSASICISEPEEVAIEPVVIGLRQSYYPVVEGQGPVEVCITALSGNFTEPSYTINYNTIDGQAKAPGDYVSANGTIEISETMTSQCIQITIESDSLNEEEECFLVSLSSSSSDFTLQSPSVATICITDAPSVAEVTIGFQQTEYTVMESENYQFLCARILSGSVAGRSIGVTFVVKNYGNDTTQSGSLLFTDDVSIQCVAVSVSSVSPGATDESCLSLSLSSPTTVSGLTLSPSLATICRVSSEVIDDTSVTVGLESGYYSVIESEGVVEVCLGVLSGILNGRSVSLDYLTINGSAKAPVDFEFESGTLQLTDSNTVQCVNVTIVNDDEDEQLEECFVFEISLSTANQDITLSLDETTICITDDDVAEVIIGLRRTTYTINEEDRYVLVCTEVLSGNIASRTISIDYQTSDGDAFAPDDYTSTSGSFDITDTNTVQCIPISIISDSVTETDEECFTYTISTTSTTPGLTLGSTSASICISEPERKMMRVGLVQAYYSAVEGQSPVQVCLHLLSGDTNSFVNYTTIDGLARAPLDYIMTSGTLEISEEDTMACVSISIIADAVEEQDEECLVVIFSSTITDLIVSPNIATICITDGPRAVLSFQPPVVLEGHTSQACLSFNNLNRLSAPVNLTLYSIPDSSTATDGMDYVGVSQSIVVDSSVTDTQICAPVITLEDNLVEDPETVIVAVSGVSGGISLIGSPASLLIYNKEIVVYQFVKTSYVVSEDVGSIIVPVQLAPSSGQLLEDVTLSVTRSGGSAMASSDYQIMDPLQLVFTAGSVAGDTMNFTIDIVDDSLVEGSEVFILTLTDTTTTAQSLPDFDTLSVAIVDDDFEINTGFDSLEYTADEGAGSIQVCVRVFGNETLSQSSLVRIQTQPGTAQASMDYASLNSIVVFPEGSTNGDRQCVNVTILDDDVIEGTESFTVQVSAVDSSSLIVIDPSASQATISIADSEVVNFRIVSPVSVDEDVGEVEVCVEQMNGELGDEVEISLRTSPVGTTASVSDYEAAQFLLTFAVGVRGPRSVCGSVRITDDILVEVDETVTLMAAFSQSSMQISLLSNSATITILDNDYVVYGWENPEYKVVEDSDSLFAQLCLSEDSGSLTFPITLTINTISISATEGEDYEALNLAVMMEIGFKAGSCIPIVLTVIKDKILESDETLQLSATDTSSHAIPSSSDGGTALVTITDDDSACQQELAAVRSSNCTSSASSSPPAVDSSSSSSASSAQVGGGVIGGFAAGVIVTIVLAAVVLLIIGWRLVPRSKKKEVEEDTITGLRNQTFEESSKM